MDPLNAVRAERRRALSTLAGGPVLLGNNGTQPRNLPINRLPFRSDSTYLYFTGCAEPSTFALIVDGACTLFLAPPEPGDELWHGEVASIQARAERLGVEHVRPLSELPDALTEHPGRLMPLAVPDAGVTARLARLTGRRLAYPASPGPRPLVDAIIQLRRTRDAFELDEMRAATRLAAEGHRLLMRSTRVGGSERALAALFEAFIGARGAVPSYHPIVTVRGEVLHNPDYPNPLTNGDLLLVDAGAESTGGYASDITRTWPVNGRFEGRQRALYTLVLAANEACIRMCRAGQRYRDIHFTATRMLAAGLVDLGLLRGAVDDLVESGASGVFFPHGVGHLIGLDVHDLENFGDRPAYAPGRSRPEQFGARYLRMDLDLEANMVVTIEPGLYFVPAIVHDRALRTRFADQVNYAEAERWLGLGGIRIEDDVRVRPASEAGGEPETLSADAPKTLDALEALIGSGPSAEERLSA
jgi:Xaa-Pro aminopeptidase